MQHGLCHDKHVAASARVREAAARSVRLQGVSQDLIGAAEPGKLCGIAAFVRMLLQGKRFVRETYASAGEGKGVSHAQLRV
jgi:hypothetical protein